MSDHRDNPLTPLRLNDLAEVVGEVLKSERKQMLEHVHRLFELAKVRASGGHDEERYRNLHRRICALESEVRRMRKGLP